MYWRVIRTAQGYGWLRPAEWENMPEHARRRVHVLMLCNTEAGARVEFAKLPQAWQGEPEPLRVGVGR